ncbi:MAG: Tn3 family transposase [Acidimicrobiales bacterium]
MPIAVAEAPQPSAYGQFPEHIERDWLGRWCHLSEADVSLARRRAGEATRLGFAAQLVTLRAIGTFLADPSAVPAPIVVSLARQLEIADPGALVGYAKLPVRWKHTAEIRRRYGYTDFASQPGHFSLLRWLYRQAWADDVGPAALFRAAHRKMLADRVVLPGEQVLTRLVGSVRERATQRLWSRLARASSPEVIAALEALLVVPEGKRRSDLDRLRRPPFSPTIAGLVQALERLGEVRSLGVGGLDLSAVPARRVAALARYAEDAWATQLADLAPQRRVATLVAFVHVLTTSARDDVIDIFDVVFGDLQRSATSRGQRRRTAELRDYDRAVGELQARMQSVLDALDDDGAIATVLAALRAEREVIVGVLGTVTTLMRPPDDPFHERLVAAYPQIRRFLPLLIDAVAMESTAPARPVLDAYRALGTWLAERPRTTRLPDTEVPMGVVTPSWEPHVRDRETGTVDRAAYACCVLDRLRVGLRRRDVYTPGSVRWGDPRAELLSPETWEQRREQACEDLALDTDPARVVANLAQTLASAWRRTADGMPNNPDLRIEHRDGADRIVVTPLDAVEEPASLVELRGMVEALLPEVEIADLPLEVHGWTGFLDEYTHISGAPSRAAGLVESLSALLVSEACNVGLTPVVDEDYPLLTRDRLNWTAHNYFRSATHAAASTRLFDYHADLDLARDAWGGGEMASADGMRFVIPVATIHAGYNPRYFGRQRGSTLYTWMADTHSTFHQTLIPGTERDSLYALDGLMANQTVLRPDTVSTDTAGASEIVFALAWALGYRYGPRLADLADHRLWVIDARADYGPLQGLARNRANTSLISGQWDQICRLAASLEARTVTPSAILRSLQRGPNPSSLGRALVELGRIIKTLHVLDYCHDADYRRAIHRILVRGESRNSLARDTFHGGRGQLRQHYQAGQENQLGALGLMVNVIVLWQTVYIQAALDHLVATGQKFDRADVARLSPLGHPTINLNGRYRTTGRAPSGGLRPLRRAR